MTQADLIVQAKQGNPTAIAALLNRALQSRGIVATAQLQQTCLTIELTAAQPIDQSAAIILIQQGMNRLQPQRIHTVLVSAQSTTESDWTWMESFSLHEVEPEILSVEPLVPSKKDDRQVRNRAEIQAPASSQPRSSNAASRKTKSNAAKGIEALLIGFGLAIVLFSVGLFKVLFHGALVLVHEVGHAATHWTFGRPAIPAVNILYGGGITITLGQVWLLNVLIYAAIAYLIYWLRAYPRLQGFAVLLTIIYTICLLTPINTMLSVAMGHGMELVAIGVCLFLSATGYFCRIPGDRAIYAMLGFFIFFSDVEFSWKLMHDPDFRTWYEGGIGGMIDNDFVILANEYFRVNLSIIASLFLVSCFLALGSSLAIALTQRK
ncbi:MAG: hypothetical protein NW224_05480 [Leptolyngbyaceae cyanobacterium bins.302]|nr:hypothetical protein [Leptolyngbyaceae cyanobacterium bins.302]